MRNLIDALLLWAALAGPLHASVVSYTGSDIAGSTDPRPNSNAAAASFLSAANGLGPTSLITFESALLGSFHNYAVAPGVSMNGTDFVSSSDQTIVNAPFSPPDVLFGYNTTAGGSNFVQLLGGNVVFSFSPAIQNFGAYISGIQGATETIAFSDGSPQTIFIPEPGTSTDGGIAFVGFTDAGASISSVTIDGLGDILGVDDVRYGFVASTPEPGSLTLLVMGLLIVGGTRFLRRRALSADLTA